MEVIETITKPWREPIDYLELVFWCIVFIVVAFVMYDSLRILTSWVKNAALGD